MNERELSKRLAIVASYLPKKAFFADIGSDHAYLPVVVCSQDHAAKAIAGEINEGPFQSAKKQVEKQSLEEQIEVIKGDGLSVITNQPIKQLIIAGMGGGLIRTILDNGKDKLTTVDRIIVQPNVDAELVRIWFDQHDYVLTAEEIIKEDGHIYEILVADRQASSNPYQDKNKEYLFGPFLIREKNAAFIEKWESEQKKRERIIAQMQQAVDLDQEKIDRLKKEIVQIEEVLGGE
ncbi:tRNA (adenine22-N1)-methyltransferase [Natronobacillus azotifigens]|uniref:tRNA (Adenine(22)-N(1))-methyltransferase TrmK n=1 Tax=Natronobacillus azotifigens TaxID=472978 RepID=A0A9J6RER1_9BACI|nr:tRNA (adenine(22)-N(1))-methyltransferase TrmK [Natronobacillus azotifigens]MCZ0704039.1 tRNA (adenine(22)-N(1))-methyltransferase TrmK [Natronobacillus azotifigens]